MSNCCTIRYCKIDVADLAAIGEKREGADSGPQWGAGKFDVRSTEVEVG